MTLKARKLCSPPTPRPLLKCTCVRSSRVGLSCRPVTLLVRRPRLCRGVQASSRTLARSIHTYSQLTAETARPTCIGPLSGSRRELHCTLARSLSDVVESKQRSTAHHTSNPPPNNREARSDPTEVGSYCDVRKTDGVSQGSGFARRTYYTAQAVPCKQRPTQVYRLLPDCWGRQRL